MARSKPRKKRTTRQRFTSINKNNMVCFDCEWGKVIDNKQHREQVAQFFAYRMDYVDNAYEPKTVAGRVDLDLKSIDKI